MDVMNRSDPLLSGTRRHCVPTPPVKAESTRCHIASRDERHQLLGEQQFLLSNGQTNRSPSLSICLWSTGRILSSDKRLEWFSAEPPTHPDGPGAGNAAGGTKGLPEEVLHSLIRGRRGCCQNDIMNVLVQARLSHSFVAEMQRSVPRHSVDFHGCEERGRNHLGVR